MNKCSVDGHNWVHTMKSPVFDKYNEGIYVMVRCDSCGIAGKKWYIYSRTVAIE